MELDYVAIGSRIKKARINTNMTQEKLANEVGVSTRFINNIERGDKGMSLETLVGIANVLAVSADDLLCDNLAHAFHVYNKEAQMVFDKCQERNAPVLVSILAAANDALEQEDRFQERLNRKKDD